MDFDYYNYNYNQVPSTSYAQTNFNRLLPTASNRFVYVNQNFQKPKVLINPNFKKTVHINPNFKGTIHVNPNVMKIPDRVLSTPENSNKKTGPKDIKINVPQPAPLSQNKIAENTANTFRRKSIHTKYKIIHQKETNAKTLDSRKIIRNKYKIDKRKEVAVKSPNLKKIIKTRYKLLNTGAINKSLIKMKENKLISISGVLYKKTPNVLKKADLTVNKSFKTKPNILKINGKFYKWNRSTFSRATTNNQTLISRYTMKKKLLLSQTKDHSKQVFLSKMNKCNIPCPVYRKFGKCHRKAKGTCFRLHNPDQVSLCTRFLQGACRKKNCLLSHKVSAEKMPTCKYYLESRCTREDCPYLHVKINPRADICKDFLEGFCGKGNECDKRHQFLCPDYEKKGSCPRRRCQYPHGRTVRKFSFHNANVAKKAIKALKAKDKAKNKAQDNEQNVRYYIDATGNNKYLDIITGDGNKNEGDDEILTSDAVVALGKRKNLGDLPSFIPFGE